METGNILSEVKSENSDDSEMDNATTCKMTLLTVPDRGQRSSKGRIL